MMVLALLSLNLLISVHVLSRAAIQQVEKQLNIEIAVRRDATPGAVEQLRTKILDLPEVVEVIHKSKEAAFAAFKDRYKDNPVLARTFQTLDRNPLGDTLAIRLQDGKRYQDLFAKIRVADTDKIIEDEFFHDYEIMVGRLEKFMATTRQVGIGLIALFAFIAGLVIVNTLRIAVYTHREEIGVMKLVGATNQYIQVPYLVQIVLLGLAAMLISAVILSLLFGFFQPYLHTLFDGVEVQLFEYYKINGARLVIEEYFGITALGLVAALLAIRRYTKV